MFFSSLYVHVPFCIKKCKYCNFYSVDLNKNLEELYIKSILNEIKLTKEFPHLLKTIYIGGGTPSCLSINALRKLLANLIEKYKLKNTLEFSIEINPATVNEDKLKLIKDYGVNRLSIGVQSFNERELKFLGRIHKSSDAIETVELAMKIGFKNISFDLIYGIPFQTLESWENTLNIATSIDIKHISVYELSVEENTQLAEDLKLGKFLLPAENKVVSMYEFATEFLESRGFEKYEISNFAKEGFQCEHNIFYWIREPYLGIGPSAHSFIDNKRFYNPSDLIAYSKALLCNRFAWIVDSVVNKIENLKEKIFLGLRMKDGIVLGEPCLLEFFQDFEKGGLVTISGNIIKLTDKGMLLSNEIFALVLLHIENCPVCKQE